MKDKAEMVRKMYQLIPSRHTDDQRILESDWARSTHDHTQLEVVVTVAAFP